MELKDIRIMATIYVDSMRATHKGVVSDKFLQSLSYEQSLDRLERICNETGRRPFGRIAEYKGTIVGFAIGSLAANPPSGYPGELKMLYVSPCNQGLGIGRTLFRSITRHFIQDNVYSMFLGAFRDNTKARKFYESLGGVLINEYPDVINGENVWICTYGWSSIHSLTQ
jgi:ribosomal protein S18 acetylase RimI-like enzyme